MFLAGVFVIEVEEDNAIIRYDVAIRAIDFKPSILLAALLTPVVDEPVAAPADIFFHAATVVAMHLAVRILRIGQQAVYDFDYSRVSRRV